MLECMDLVERRATEAARHPWETARALAIEQLLRRLKLHRPRVLDVGAGDGFLVARLANQLDWGETVAQDIHLTEAVIRQVRTPGIQYVRELSELEARRFDLILLLDVLEHIQEPGPFLEQLWTQHLAERGSVLITVPAFQVLFTQHDHDLRHFRRYSLSEIADVASRAGLEVRESGYLFATLLLPRALSKLRERLAGRASAPSEFGIGGWNAPPAVTKLLHGALSLDCGICLWAQRRGVVLPGLSAWLLCTEPR